MAQYRMTSMLPVLVAVVLLAFSAIPPTYPKSISKSPPPSASVQERLKALRELSIEAGIPQTHLDQDVCYTDACIDAAFDILKSINASVDPCQDFFQFSCGRWIADNPIPEDQSVWSKHTEMNAEVLKVTLQIFLEPQNETDPKPLNQAKQFYSQCTDTDAMERAGLTKLKEVIRDIGGWQLLDPDNWDANNFDWLKAIAETIRKSGSFPLFGSMNVANYADTNKQILMIDQGSFGQLPRAILLDRANNQKLFEAYETYIFQIAKELGSERTEDQLRAVAKDIIALEEKLAAFKRPDENRADFGTMFNVYTLQKYQDETDDIDNNFKVSWTDFLQKLYTPAGVDDIGADEEIVVFEPEYMKKLIPLLAEEDTKGEHLIANYIVWSLVSVLASDTTKAMRDITFEFEKQLSGGNELPPREISCAIMATRLFGLPVSSRYIQLVFSEESKEEVSQMAKDIKEVFDEIVMEADWMKDETKEKALEKNNAMKHLVAYPEWIHNKTALEDQFKEMELGDDHFESILNFVEFKMNSGLKAIRLPSDREMWSYAPLTDINAFHGVYYNMILILVGILQSPYYGGGRPKHQNYAGVGMVIGHELTHGFDHMGSQFDKNGNMVNWWDDETKAAYQEKGDCMVDQYNKYCYDFDDGQKLCLNGQLGRGENIADNGGIRESYRAYKKYVERNGPELRLPGLETFDTEQLFFLGFGTSWCGYLTPEALRKQLAIDGHSTFEYRVIGPLKNSPEFAEVYKCPENSDGMNPPANQKCRVW